MAEDKIHPHAFWLYGVIVALAIKSALESVFPHIFSLLEGEKWWPEALRLFVFLTLAIRLYLRAAEFFDSNYPGQDQSLKHSVSAAEVSRFPDSPIQGAQVQSLGQHIPATTSQSGYAVDFIFGFAHFLFFYGLAMSLDVHGRSEWPFRVLLIVTLLYDLVWVWFSQKRKMIRKWAVLNTLTVLIASVGYLIPDRLSIGSHYCEAIALITVFAFSCVDMVRVITGRDWLSDWVMSLFGTSS
jgi:hypothetical protein